MQNNKQVNILLPYIHTAVGWGGRQARLDTYVGAFRQVSTERERERLRWILFLFARAPQQSVLQRRIQTSNVMQWYDQRLDGPIKEQDFRRDPPTSPPWRQQNPNCGFECDHDDGGNGDLSVGGLDCGGRSTRCAGGNGTMVGEGGLVCAGGGDGGGEGDDSAVLRSLEKVLAKHSANQRRRPSKEVCMYAGRYSSKI